MQYVTTEGAQGICPPGWHIPKLAEFQTLSSSVSGDGNALKAVGQGTGTNTSGFSALLAGSRDEYGSFLFLGQYSFFWSSKENDPMFAINLYLIYNENGINLNGGSKEHGLSVRCLKDSGD